MKRITIITALAAGLAWAADARATGWVLTGDYSQFGRLRAFAEASPWSTGSDLAVTPGDAVGREHDGLLYVVGRGGASVLQVYDPANGMALLREFSLGSGRNPQDIAFDTQGRAFVSCYDAAVLLRVDTQAGAVAEVIPTTAFADADGLPETAWMVARGDRLFIAAQRLDRSTWGPSGPGLVLVYDAAAGAWVDCNPVQPGTQAITLAGGNPYTRIEVLGVDGVEKLRVGCVGGYGALDGGIDQLDPHALASEGWVATEAQLGGDISAFVTTSPSSIYAVVGDVNTFNTNLMRWQGGAGSALVRAGGGFVFADLAWDGGCQLFLADRTPAADGLRVFNACTGLALGSAPVPTGLPPFSFVLTADPVAAPAPPVPAAAALRLAPAFPNPCNPSARLAVAGSAGEVVEVLVTDAAGRAVGRRALRLAADGRGSYEFDGRDAGGRALPAGVYRIIARGAAATATRLVTLVK